MIGVKQAFAAHKAPSVKEIDPLKRVVLLLLSKLQRALKTHPRRAKIVITGFNTDVEHGGIVYHVQTEDKGLASPLILTLVYTGGTILASKRVAYDDLIAEGFDERVLAERLTRQHKLVCAAIRTGRIEDLKRMTEREATGRTAARAAVAGKQKPKRIAETFVAKVDGETKKILPVTVRTATQGKLADFARADAATKDDLHLSLLDEKEFRGGEEVTFGVRVGRGADGNEAAAAAEVDVKILGSTFRPLLFSAKTNAQGIATVRAELPHFKTGRAAILVRATLNGYEAELRRIVQQG